MASVVKENIERANEGLQREIEEKNRQKVEAPIRIQLLINIINLIFYLL